MEKKYCLNCSEVIVGRTDKKFCDDSCRSNYHSRCSTEDSRFVKHINLVLKRNRQILVQLNPEGKVKIQRRILLEKGFDFRHFTGIYKTEKNACYYFCYEMGYLLLEQDDVLLVKKKPDHR
jgi:hypothetical protein